MGYGYAFNGEIQANEEDCLIPSKPIKDRWLRRELMEGGFSEPDADALDTQLVEIAQEVFKEFKQSLDGNSINYLLSIEMKEEEITVHFHSSDNGNRFQFHIGNSSQTDIITLSTEAYKNLRKKYNSVQPIKTDEDEGKFLIQLLLLLLRYNTVSGDVRGYQMALPESVFSFLKSEYGLQHECFASPMNACSLIGSFCSRFPDTDKSFGSKGSFFEFTAEEGCFESNPPFVEECMIRNIKHILELMEKAEIQKKALTFFIVVPRWDDSDCESYNLTVYGTRERPNSEAKGKYFVTMIALDKDQHFYRNGMAYQDNFKVMKARHNSLMLVLQSPKARDLHPIDEKVFEKKVNLIWTTENHEFTRHVRKSCKRDTPVDTSQGPVRSNIKLYKDHSSDDFSSKRR